MAYDCHQDENSLTYATCAMNSMNSNIKRVEECAWIGDEGVWCKSEVHGKIYHKRDYVAACMKWRTAYFCGWYRLHSNLQTELAVETFSTFFAGAPRDYIYPPIKLKKLKANHHKLVLSMLMRTTKLPHCEFELHVKINKLKVLERNAKTLQHWGDLLLSGWALTWEL